MYTNVSSTHGSGPCMIIEVGKQGNKSSKDKSVATKNSECNL